MPGSAEPYAFLDIALAGLLGHSPRVTRESPFRSSCSIGPGSAHCWSVPGCRSPSVGGVETGPRRDAGELVPDGGEAVGALAERWAKELDVEAGLERVWGLR